jgi:hypothetical protein
MLKPSLILFSILFSLASYAQKKDSAFVSFEQTELELKALQKKMFYSKKDEERFEANKKFLKILESSLARQESMQYSFDSLRDISRLMAPDKKFRIITWNIPKNDGTHAYFGFIQVNNVKVQKVGLFKRTTTNEYEVFQLVDKSGTVKNPETHVSDPSKWFGMLYFDIIKCDDYYTLLGWDGNDNLVTRKFVDVLYFRPDGTPVFGKDVFKVPKKSPKRAMFEYSSEVSMSMKYFDRSGQIIFSHLAPKDEGSVLQGQYQYYGPDGSFDAYEQSKGRWVLVENVDIRNAKSDRDKEWNNPHNINASKKEKLMPKK